jgi:hypothetical protein
MAAFASTKETPMRRIIAAGLLGLALLLPVPVAARGDPGFIAMGDWAVADYELHPDGCYSFYPNVAYYVGERGGDLGTPLWIWSDVSVTLVVYDRCAAWAEVARLYGWTPVPPTIESLESATVDFVSFRIDDGAGGWLTATIDLSWTAIGGATPSGQTWGVKSYRRTQAMVAADLAGTLTITDGNTGWGQLTFGPDDAFNAELGKFIERWGP